MKANEIMIGDWFRYRYTIDNREIIRTFRISRIENELKKYYVWGDGFGRMCFPERLEPIPLTPEILEKNGFHYTNNHTLKGADTYVLNLEQRGFYLTITIKLNDWFAIDSWDDRMYRMAEISTGRWTVHELQHALRLCGIDKEITI